MISYHAIDKGLRFSSFLKVFKLLANFLTAVFLKTNQTPTQTCINSDSRFKNTVLHAQ